MTDGSFAVRVTTTVMQQFQTYSGGTVKITRLKMELYTNFIGVKIIVYIVYKFYII